tara:strand:- start:4 stop:786 length:783 start_codon:yes stop_codon:yes gene_type:complete
MPIQQMMLGLGGSKIITSNLLFHYDIGHSSSYSGSGTTVNDLSGNGNDATILAPESPSYSSNDGGYLIFNNEAEANHPSNHTAIEVDGSNNNSDFAIGNDQFSFEVWLYLDDVVSNAQNDELYIGGQDRNGTANKGVVFKYIHYSSTNQLSVTFGDSVIGESSGWGVVHTIPTTTWTYVATGRRSSNEVFINVDGDDKYTATFPARELLTPYRKFEIGNGVFSSKEWDGRIAIARYSIGGSLSESDLLHNYNTQKSRFGL